MATNQQPVDFTSYDNSDKLVHAFAFYSLSILMDTAYPASCLLLRKAAFLVSFGIFIELVQVYFHWRSAEVIDLVADCIGMALYLGPVLVVRRMQKLRRN